MPRERENPFAGASSIVPSVPPAALAPQETDGTGLAAAVRAEAKQGRPAKTAITIRLPEGLANKVRSAAIVDGAERGVRGLSAWIAVVLQEEVERVEQRRGVVLAETPVGVMPQGWIAHQ